MPLNIVDAISDGAGGITYVPASDSTYRRGARIIYFSLTHAVVGKLYIKDDQDPVAQSWRIEFTFSKAAIRNYHIRVAFDNPEQLGSAVAEGCL